METLRQPIHAHDRTVLQVAPRKKRRLRRLGGLAIALLALAMMLLWWVGVFGGNVREVAPGRFYRSAQLSGVTLENALKRDGIRTVINLRGPRTEEFYRSEIEVCRSLGVAHYDVSLSATHLPKPAELRRLLSAIDHAPKPIMIHCQGGADRAGLASTLYENVYEGVPLDRAEREQLTWRYGHLAFTNSRAMDRFFDLYRQNSGGQDLRSWIERSYPMVYERETAPR